MAEKAGGGLLGKSVPGPEAGPGKKKSKTSGGREVGNGFSGPEDRARLL